MRKILCMATAAAALESFALEETVGNYTWSYEVNGDTATICKTEVSDSGRIDYTVAVSPRPKGHLAIPGTLGGKPVVRIGPHAFYYCSGLTSVAIPDSVAAIGTIAFASCYNLKAVTIPDSVVNIEDGAFSYCTALASVMIGNSVKNIGDRAFRDCSRLTRLEIPNSVTNIGRDAFNSAGLISITIPASVKTIGATSFNRGTLVYLRGLDTKIARWHDLEVYGLWLVPRANSEVLNELGTIVPQNGADSEDEYFLNSQFSHYFGGFMETANSADARVVSCKIRDDDPTVMDVVYRVESAKPTVKIRVLAFEDGERSFTKVVRPETFVDGTEPSDWDAVEANVEHTLSWKVSSDWAAKLAKVKFEVMTCEDDLLPLELVYIPASDKYKAMKFSRNKISQHQIFDALLWLYADKTPGLTIEDGNLLNLDGTTLFSYGSPTLQGSEFVFSEMGYSMLSGDMLDYVNEETRLELYQGGNYGYKYVEN